jgi:polar amino acid transport system substrate-binding protein
VLRLPKFRVMGITGLAVAAAVAAVAASPTTGSVRAPDPSLPANIQKSGVLKVATNYGWPPFDFKGSNGKGQGFDVDVLNAIAKQLGIRAEFTNLDFSSIIPSVANGRFDAAANEFSDIASRRGVVQFVDYFRAGIGVLVRRDYKGHISSRDLCGHTLSLTTGSSQVELGRRISKKCVADGKKPIKFVMFSDSAPTILAVANGRVEAFMTDVAVGVYLTRTSNRTLKVLPGVVPGSENDAGIVVAKKNTQLAKAIKKGLQALIDNGQYQKLLTKWGVPNQGVKKATINGH